ncbi:SepA family multidrug efflux transporter [Rummeliibacillus pycnus]|uniref:SepA family multidrug efflux transporter n=1 Tax=Rummeliibacillus pycnus TaxID=101070 RepID=UPI000C9BDA42|nr:SepA family multidrug efflux transporter [Rummeliibacillus pycnus]
MFKHKKIKIRVSGWSALLLIIAILCISLTLAITVPYFGFYGLYTILAKFNLASIDIFEKWYQDLFYFGWFIILIFSMIILLDIICLFIIASCNIKLTKSIDTISTFVQFVISVVLFKKFIVTGFERINVTWSGSIILFLLLYIVVAVFSYEKTNNA